VFEVELETGHLVVTGAGVDDDAIRAAVIEAGLRDIRLNPSGRRRSLESTLEPGGP